MAKYPFYQICWKPVIHWGSTQIQTGAKIQFSFSIFLKKKKERKINFLDFTIQPLKEDSKGYLDIGWSLQNNTNRLSVNESKPDRFHSPSRKCVFGGHKNINKQKLPPKYLSFNKTTVFWIKTGEMSSAHQPGLGFKKVTGRVRVTPSCQALSFRNTV